MKPRFSLSESVADAAMVVAAAKTIQAMRDDALCDDALGRCLRLAALPAVGDCPCDGTDDGTARSRHRSGNSHGWKGRPSIHNLPMTR